MGKLKYNIKIMGDEKHWKKGMSSNKKENKNGIPFIHHPEPIHAMLGKKEWNVWNGNKMLKDGKNTQMRRDACMINTRGDTCKFGRKVGEEELGARKWPDRPHGVHT